MIKFKDFIKEEKEEDPFYRLIEDIRSLIDDNIGLKEVRYGDGDMEVDPRTVDLAANAIVKMLKEKDYLAGEDVYTEKDEPKD